MNDSRTEANNPLQQYSLVFSVTMLLVSTVFGSGQSVLVFAAILMSKSLRKVHNVLIVSLLITISIFGFIWMPLTTIQLFQYKMYTITSPTLKHASHALYILIICAIASILLALAVHNLLIISSKKYKVSRKRANIVGVILGSALSVLIMIIYTAVSISLDSLPISSDYFLTIQRLPFQVKIIVFTILIVSLMIMLIAMVIKIKSKDNSTFDGGSISRTSSCKDCNVMPSSVPVIKEPQIEESDNDNVSMHKPERPSTPIVTHEAQNTDNVSEVGSLQPQNKIRKNSLTINFGPMLNRRRHTICQIGDTGPQFSPIERAKDYNYVRKFSVDVMALQAQLENPKTFSTERTFHSQQELSMKYDDTSSVRKSGGNSLGSIREDEDRAKNDDETSETSKCIETDMNVITEHLTQKQSETCRHLQVRLRVVRFSAFMIATFLLAMLPVYITETLQTNIHRASYINVITYTTAISTLQTIAYPQFLLCMDHRIKCSIRDLVHGIQRQLVRSDKNDSCPTTKLDDSLHITKPI